MANPDNELKQRAERIINQVISEFDSEIAQLPQGGVDAATIASLKKRMEARCLARLKKWGLAA